MRTPTSSWLTTAAVLILIISLFTGSWLLLSLLLPILALIAVSVSTAARPFGITISRQLDAIRLPEGELIEVRLTIDNDGARIPLLEVYDVLPREMVVEEGSDHIVTRVPANGTVNVVYKARGTRKGRYRIGPTVLRTWNSFRTSYEERILTSNEVVTVIPGGEDIRRIKISPRKTRMWFGQIRSRRAGIGTDFWGIKEYHAGDELRKINWKSSARFEKLFVNQYEGERSGDAVIILDARIESDVEVGRKSTVESGIRAAVSVAAKILESRNRAGLIIQRDVLDWVYPAYGRKQLFRIVDALVQVRPGGRWPFEHVTWVISRFFPTHSQVIMITPLIDKKAVDCVVDLCARGHDVLIISPSPLQEGTKSGPERVAQAILKMERDNTIRNLRRYASVVDWNTSKPLASALRVVGPYPGRR